MTMSEWIKNNLWSIIITVVGVAVTFSLYGYRIDNLEKDVAEARAQIQVLNTQQTQVQVQLAQIGTDVLYIKASLDRLLR